MFFLPTGIMMINKTGTVWDAEARAAACINVRRCSRFCVPLFKTSI